MAKPKYTTTEDGITFNLLDVHTVDRLVKNGDIRLPRKGLDAPKDERWNTKQMSSKLLQGILNGSSIPEIAQSLMEVIGNNKVSAVRNARTMVTGAENAGRLGSYQDLAEKGVVQKKVWLATHDERVRESHIEIDGEERDPDKAFSNGLMYPGDTDPSVDPSEVWNCRCSMKDHIIGFRRADGSISYIEGEGPANPAPQEEAQPAEKERIESGALETVMSKDDYTRFMDLVNEADNGELYRHYADEIEDLTIKKSGGQFDKATQSIEFSYEKGDAEGINRYSTLAHEYNHFFDYSIGKDETLHFIEIDLINERCQIGSGAVKPVREWASASDEFLAALRTDMQALKDKGFAECYTEFKQTTELRNSTNAVQDALDGFYGTQKDFYGWGHGNSYYNRLYNDFIQSFNHQNELRDAYNELDFNVKSQAQAKSIFRQYRAASEAWANVGSAVTCGGAELEAVEKYMPNTLAAYKEIVGGLKYE